MAGDGPAAARAALMLYSAVVSRAVPVSTLDTAEAVKITENIFRAVNIALVNELKLVFERMDIDIWEVIEAAKTKPFGFMPFYPGPGLGGHCIPIDPFYLTWRAREFDAPTRFIELAGEIDTNMPLHVVNRLAEALDARACKALHGAKILLFGVAYKKNVEDCRENPAFKLLDLLVQRGAEVDYYDPLVPVIPEMRSYQEFAAKRSVGWNWRRSLPTMRRSCTDHDDVDYGDLVAASRLVIDCRNATRSVVAGRENREGVKPPG